MRLEKLGELIHEFVNDETLEEMVEWVINNYTKLGYEIFGDNDSWELGFNDTLIINISKQKDVVLSLVKSAIPVDGEYIYRFDMVWKDGEFSHRDIVIGTLVDNVYTLPGDYGGFSFTIKGTTERLRSNYAWALAENTLENRRRIIRYDEEMVKYKEHMVFMEELRSAIVTLDKSEPNNEELMCDEEE